MDSIRVGAFHTHAEAQAAMGYLRGHGVRARVVADDAGALDPGLAFGTARVTLLVPVDQALEARRLLTAVDPEGEPDRRREIVGALIVVAVVAAIIAAVALLTV